MKFSDFLLEQITPLYHQILYHPFNCELAEGTLEEEKFLFYLEQDALYLEEAARALSLVAGRMDSTKQIPLFLEFALETIATQQDVLTQYLRFSHPIEPSLACLSYTRHLLAKASSAPLGEVIAAHLPCFWTYKKMGEDMQITSDNPYINWIKTYTLCEASRTITVCLELIDEIAKTASSQDLEEIQKSCIDSTLYEWHFWNDSYHQTTFKSALALPLYAAALG